ncbi:MAG: hypothetical protein ACREEW_07495 [Caulobacteraceae bacterium]
MKLVSVVIAGALVASAASAAAAPIPGTHGAHILDDARSQDGLNDELVYVTCVWGETKKDEPSGSPPEDIATAAIMGCNLFREKVPGYLEQVQHIPAGLVDGAMADLDKRARDMAITRVVRLRACRHTKICAMGKE